MKTPESGVFIEALAEREGFEPSVQVNLYAGFRIQEASLNINEYSTYKTMDKFCVVFV